MATLIKSEGSIRPLSTLIAGPFRSVNILLCFTAQVDIIRRAKVVAPALRGHLTRARRGATGQSPIANQGGCGPQGLKHDGRGGRPL